MRILVLLVVGVTLAFASAANSGAAWAQAPSACQPVIWLGHGVQPPQLAGQAGNFAVQPGRAFPIQAGGTVKITWGQTYTVALLRPVGITSAQVVVDYGPTSKRRDFETRNNTLVRAITIDEANLPGPGLYHVSLHTNGRGCNLDLQVDVRGISPIETRLGKAAFSGAALGMLLVLVGLVGAWRGSRAKALMAVIVGGLVAGPSLAVLSQQFGLLVLTNDWLVAWAAPIPVIGSTASFVLNHLGNAARNARERGPIQDTKPPEGSVSSSGSTTGGSPGAEAGPGSGTTAEGPPGAEAGPGSEGRTGPTVAAKDPEPPRDAYALLDCPDAVPAAQEFELQVGLSASPVEGVAGAPHLVLPPRITGGYTLIVHVVAEGFSLRVGETWRQQFRITGSDPFPSATLHLTPPSPVTDFGSGVIHATYSVDGETIGYGVRAVVVVRPGAAVVAPGRTTGENTLLTIPQGETAPDLTVWIMGGASPGRLLWTLTSRWVDIDIPDHELQVDIGEEPGAFAGQLVDGAGAQEGQPGMFDYFAGIGSRIFDHMPQEFWTALKACATHARAEGRAPDVFIISSEPYVPWELARLDEPLDAALPPFLGAQARVGRWVLGKARPRLPAPINVSATAVAVVAGVYDRVPGWNRLEEAELESAELQAQFQALPVAATIADVLACLKGNPGADVLHFAVHGIYDPTSTLNGLVLTDGLALTPEQVRAQHLKQAPFVFLNACQVGNGDRVLGDYAGMAEAFLYAGAAGVVAPLWSIDDTVAREIALRFYESAFSGESPAEILRRERSAFTDSPDTLSATYLAYLFYGHPSMKLSRSGG